MVKANCNRQNDLLKATATICIKDNTEITIKSFTSQTNMKKALQF